MGEMRNVYKILVGKPEGKRPLGKPRRRFENNIRLDPREIRWEVDRINVDEVSDHWLALVNTVMNIRVL
jgi:hypothetical protein